MARFVPRLGVTRYEADEYFRMALKAYNKNNLEEAIQNATRALELVPNNAEYLAARGLFYLEHGIPDKAEADFDASLRRHAYDLLAHYGKGILAYQRKDYPDALRHFQAAWATNPERPETLYYLGLTYHRQHDNRNAQQFMEQAQRFFEKEDDRKNARNAGRWVGEFVRIIERERRRNTSD